MKIFSFIVVYFMYFIALSQGESKNQLAKDSLNITFKDTIFEIAIDSLSNEMGVIVSDEPFYFTKYFKYIGSDSLFINGIFTTDPHVICQHPRERLVPDKIYSIKICFASTGKRGRFKKQMGFTLSNDKSITIRLTGTFLLRKEIEVEK